MNNSRRDGRDGRNGMENSNYVPHISTAKRLRLEREAVLGGDTIDGTRSGGNGDDIAGLDRSAMAKSRKKLAAVGTTGTGGDGGDGGGGEYAEGGGQHRSDDDERNVNNSPPQQQEEEEEDDEDPDAAAQSLLEQAAKLKQSMTAVERQKLAQKEEENRILREASKVQTNALQAASELAHGVIYTESMPTSWTCPRHILAQGEQVWDKIRNNWHILVEGHDPPPPMKSFADMKFPKPILDYLDQRNIKRPTPIQMQGLPVALAGRDMVGIAFTGSGKTMTFSLPLVMAALEEEVRMPLVGGEGPVGIILAPSRELVRQTYEIVENLCQALANTARFPKLRCQLVIGGENARDQLQPFRDVGVHCVVASPGRLRDFLKKKNITLDICRFICLDEVRPCLMYGMICLNVILSPIIIFTHACAGFVCNVSIG